MHHVAQTILGMIYMMGQGVAKNEQAGEKWFRLAAAQGEATAQTNLGLMYEKGHGVTQNDK